MLQFQMSKFRLGSDYTQGFEKSLLGSVQAHLGQLYQELLALLRPRIRAQHLVIVPHGILHYVPFHALFDGSAYLDRLVLDFLRAQFQRLRATASASPRARRAPR